MALRQIVYISAASGDIGRADLDNILESARKNNDRNEVTGVLMYLDGAFLQVLEAETEIAEKTFRRITSDPRHGNVFKILDAEVPERRFPDWSMAFSSLMHDELVANPALFEKTGGTWSVKRDSHLGDKLSVIFDTFFHVNSGNSRN